MRDMLNIFNSKLWTVLLGLCALISCEQHEADPLFYQISPTHSGVDFVNRLIPTDTLNIINFRYYYNGGGVGVGDVNGDGLPDLYFSGNQVSSRLYINLGGMKFKDVTLQAGVNTQRWATGVAMVDINADGLLDIYVGMSGSEHPSARTNVLFVNQGNDKGGIPHFIEQASHYGLNDAGYTTQTAFLDYDLDGDLDAYILSASNSDFYGLDIRSPVEDGTGTSTDRLYRNNGDGTFTDVSIEAGITIEGFGLGIGVTDINRDSWPDIYISNDYLSSDLLYINQGDSLGIHQGFKEQAAQYMSHQSHFSMGMDIGDINNDDRMDIFTLDMWPAHNEGQKMMAGVMDYDRFQLALKRGYVPQYMRNMLQLNRGMDSYGRTQFSEIGQFAGVHMTDWSWSALMADYNNDGWLDIHVTNGFAKDITNMDFVAYDMNEAFHIANTESRENKIKDIYNKLPSLKRQNYCFTNRGDFKFIPALYTKDKLLSFSNGAAYSDLDLDGDIDLVVNNIDEPAFILDNQTNTQKDHKWLQIRLEGANGNPNGIGTRITILHGDKKQVREQNPYRGYQSTVDPIIHFGLGNDTIVERLEVIWPDGKTQQITNIRGDQMLRVKYTDAHRGQSESKAEVLATKRIFNEINDSSWLSFRHKENSFVDVKFQPLLLMQHSTLGPGIAQGDIDKNGWSDLYIGGAFGQSGNVCLQQADGSFIYTEIPGENYEDAGSLLFDADMDEDLDLYVVSGGAMYPDQHINYTDRLYLNEGNGIFNMCKECLPELATSGSCVIAADFDRDGDQDLFVGGRMIPGTYPMPPRSYLLENDRGVFRDIISEMDSTLEQIGMVTSALWTDFNQDQWVDLIVVGEGMPITFWENDQGVLKNITFQIDLIENRGWWNSISGGDMDNDGDIDYILGNLGLNSRFKVSAKYPFLCYAKDFDLNGKPDAVSFAYQSNAKGQLKLFPVHPPMTMLNQLVYLKKRFNRFEYFASATLDEIFSAEQLKDAYKLQYEYAASAYLENQGRGKYTLRPLPDIAQLAPIFGTSVCDIDGDSYLDILYTGNFYGASVDIGRYDALIGGYLKGNGDGTFTPIPPGISGLWISGDTRSMVRLLTPNDERLIVGRNNDIPNIYTRNFQQNIQVKEWEKGALGARIYFSNGSMRRVEKYQGSGFWSQTPNYFTVHTNVDSVVFDQ